MPIENISLLLFGSCMAEFNSCFHCIVYSFVYALYLSLIYYNINSHDGISFICFIGPMFSWSAAFMYSCVVFNNFQAAVVHFDYLVLWFAEVCTSLSSTCGITWGRSTYCYLQEYTSGDCWDRNY